MKTQEKNKQYVTPTKSIYFTRPRVNLVTGYPEERVSTSKKPLENHISIGHIK